MLKSDFFYNLPEELIAQVPIEPRDASRLLMMDKQTGALTDGTFRDIVHPINAAFRAELENAVIDAYHVQLIASRESEAATADDTDTADVPY